MGFHYGQGSAFGNGTAIYKFDAGAARMTSFTLTMPQGSSGAVLYLTGLDDGGGTGSLVPEPESWALMIAGFGLVGASIRRRRAVAA